MLWILGIIVVALGIAASVGVVLNNISLEFTTLRKRVVELEASFIATAAKCADLQRLVHMDKQAHNDIEVLVKKLCVNQDLISQVLDGKVDVCQCGHTCDCHEFDTNSS